MLSHMCRADSRGRARTGHSSLLATLVYTWKRRKMEQTWTINIPPTELCSPALVPISACFFFSLSKRFDFCCCWGNWLNSLNTNSDGIQSFWLMSKYSRICQENISNWVSFVYQKLWRYLLLFKFGCGLAQYEPNTFWLDCCCILEQLKLQRFMEIGLHNPRGYRLCHNLHRNLRSL